MMFKCTTSNRLDQKMRSQNRSYKLVNTVLKTNSVHLVHHIFNMALFKRLAYKICPRKDLGMF